MMFVAGVCAVGVAWCACACLAQSPNFQHPTLLFMACGSKKMLAPHRLFLGELPLFLQKNSRNNSCNTELRLMGRVTQVSHDKSALDSSSTTTWQSKNHDQDVALIVIDDGTSSVDVVNTTSHPIVEVGQLIDCIGNIYIVPEPDPSSGPGKQSVRNYYLEATSVSLVHNSQEEILRQLELSKRNTNIDNVHVTQYSTILQKKIPKNRVLTSYHLEKHLNPLHNTTYPFPSLTLNSEDAFRYISYSAKRGGISNGELETLVGATEIRDKRAVREAVEELKASGTVHVKEGRLFPL